MRCTHSIVDRGGSILGSPAAAVPVELA
jgi:hypothetical protein